jgi:hypothetical protein
VTEPVPVEVTPPGFLVNVHVPVGGNPLSTTPPVETVQVGGVTVPVAGAAGVGGCAFITTFPVVTEIQPDAFVTLKV